MKREAKIILVGGLLGAIWGLVGLFYAWSSSCCRIDHYIIGLPSFISSVLLRFLFENLLCSGSDCFTPGMMFGNFLLSPIIGLLIGSVFGFFVSRWFK